VPAAVRADTAPHADPARQIDQIFAEWNKPDTPGASVAVIRSGKQIFAKGYGQATLEYPAPIAADTIFHVASVTKQFTAMSLVLLEQDGNLSLEDDLHKYLPELPDHGHKITIRNLLQHTSGIRDQWQTLGLAGWRLDDVITQKQILRMLFRQKELNFEPGTKHLYSNGATRWRPKSCIACRRRDSTTSRPSGSSSRSECRARMCAMIIPVSCQVARIPIRA
jgi:CubicO group peptidase (beta-lactamase class C family)